MGWWLLLWPWEPENGGWPHNEGCVVQFWHPYQYSGEDYPAGDNRLVLSITSSLWRPPDLPNMVVLYLGTALNYLGSYLKSRVFQVSLIIVWEACESLASYSLIPVSILSLTQSDELDSSGTCHGSPLCRSLVTLRAGILQGGLGIQETCSHASFSSWTRTELLRLSLLIIEKEDISYLTVSRHVRAPAGCAEVC